MTSAQDVLNVGRAHLGYLEGPNNDNMFGRWYGMNNVSWCAEFVEYCFAMGGAPLPYRSASVNQLAAWAQSHGIWRPSTQCQPGDIICFDWTGTASGRDWARTHTGLVEQNIGGNITTIEGNTGAPEGVWRKVWVAGGSLIWGTIDCQLLYVNAPNRPGQPNNRFANEPIVRQGSGGQPVKDLQMAINAVDPSRHLGVDGQFGPATQQAVIDFQRIMKLPVDGVVGPKTWAALDFLLDQKGR